MAKLTSKQENFCLEYVKSRNASDAFRQAYDCTKWQAKSVHERASRLLAQVKIRSRVDELMAPIIKRSQVNAEYVLTRHSEIDNMDICDILNDDWTIKPLSIWPKTWRSYLSGIDVVEMRSAQSDPEAAVAYLKKMKWPDKLKNLETLGKHVDVQAYRENKEVTHKFDKIPSSALMDELNGILNSAEDD